MTRIMTVSNLKRPDDDDDHGTPRQRPSYFRSLSADDEGHTLGSAIDPTSSCTSTHVADSVCPSSSCSLSSNKKTTSSSKPCHSIKSIVTGLILACQVLLFTYLLIHTKLVNSINSKGFDISSLTLPADIDAFFTSSSTSDYADTTRPRNFRKSTADDPNVDISASVLTPKKLMPFSKLVDIMKKEPFAHEGNPLLGQYDLGDEGSIMFPHSDLALLMPDELDSPQPGVFDKDEDPDGTLLTVDASFKSVIGTKEKEDSSPHSSSDQALLTRRGYKVGRSYNAGPTINQDRAFIANFLINANKSEGNQEVQSQHRQQDQPSALLMGIFDGHGQQGHTVSNYLAVEFSRVFASILQQQEQTRHGAPALFERIQDPKNEAKIVSSFKNALVDTFVTMDQNEPIKGNSGSTASTLFYPGVGSKLYIANAGDSSTVLVRYSKSNRRSTIVFVNRKHTADLKDEAERIKRVGGYVTKPLNLGSKQRPGGIRGGRIIIPDVPGGSSTGVGLALTTTRAIGDYGGKAEGITAEPQIAVWDVNAQHHQSPQEEQDDSEWFAIVGSDGLFDMLDPAVVAEYLSQSLYKDDQNNSNMAPLEACERLIREASRLWAMAPIDGYRYRDDITLGVSKLQFNL